MSKQDPYISVIIPAYNRAAYIVDAVNSVLDQKDAPWSTEIIIIDDGSTDNTAEIVAATFKDKVRYVRIPQSGGRPAVPRNVGLKLAKGELIAFHDSDDLWVTDKLKTQVPLFEKDKDLMLSYGGAEIMDSHGNKTGKQVVADAKKLKKGEKFESLVEENVISTLTVVARKEALLAVGYFNESPAVSAVEDYELWLRVAAKFPKGVQSIDKTLAYYRVHDQNISTASSLKAVTRILNIYDELWSQAKLTAKQKEILENKMTTMHEGWGNLQLEESHSGKPTVSVIMGVYNGASFLGPAIEGILSQTFTDFEFIIIDDGSSDNSVDIIRSYADPRIRLVRQTNHGLVNSLNKAIKLSRGKYLARQDADDISLPTRFEKELQMFAANPKLGVVGTYFTYVDEQTLEPKETIAYPSLPIDVKRALYLNNPLGHGTTMIRKGVFDAMEPYTDKYGPTEDLELWGRISDRWEIAIVPESLYWYRLNPNSISHTKAAIQQKYAQQLRDKQWTKRPSYKRISRVLKDNKYYRRAQYPGAAKVHRLYVDQQIDIARELLSRGWIVGGMYSALAASMVDLRAVPRFFKPTLRGIKKKIRGGKR